MRPVESIEIFNEQQVSKQKANMNKEKTCKKNVCFIWLISELVDESEEGSEVTLAQKNEVAYSSSMHSGIVSSCCTLFRAMLRETKPMGPTHSTTKLVAALAIFTA